MIVIGVRGMLNKLLRNVLKYEILYLYSRDYLFSVHHFFFYVSPRLNKVLRTFATFSENCDTNKFI